MPFRVYIRDAERKQLSDQAMSLCVQSLKSQIKNMNTLSHSAMQKLLLDIFKAYQRVQKHIVAKESTFAAMLTDVYKNIVQENVRLSGCLFSVLLLYIFFIFRYLKMSVFWIWL